MDAERLDMAQLTSDKNIIKAHNILLDCAWEIADFRRNGAFYYIVYKNESDKLEIFGTSSKLLFKMNNEDVKELTEDSLIRTILF